MNKASGSVSFCQTVLPGNEAMLIPTSVDDWAELAVPGTDYWCGTAAQSVSSFISPRCGFADVHVATISTHQELDVTKPAYGAAKTAPLAIGLLT
jgi:hypothetical protein